MSYAQRGGGGAASRCHALTARSCVVSITKLCVQHIPREAYITTSYAPNRARSCTAVAHPNSLGASVTATRAQACRSNHIQPPSTCSTHHQMPKHCSSENPSHQTVYTHIPCTLLAPTASTRTWMPSWAMHAFCQVWHFVIWSHSWCMFGRFCGADTHSQF